VLSRYARFRLNHPVLALTEELAWVVAFVVILSLSGHALFAIIGGSLMGLVILFGEWRRRQQG
jgi:hypothetical protein